MGSVLSDDIVSSVEMEGGVIEMVKDFTYLGSTLSVYGETAREVDFQIAKASKAFGSLQLSIFTNNSYSFCPYKSKVVIVSNLLCVAET